MEELVWTNAMAVSGIILVITFVGIFTEAVHGFHRTKFAMGGAGLMILAGQYFGFYNTELAVEAVDWNVVFLLGGMMTIVGIMIPTGGFQYLAYKIADITKGNLFLMMAMMGTLVTGLSLLLDNVTTVVIFGPLIILICKSMKVTPIPYLLAAALLSDTGGVATLVGDPAEPDDRFRRGHRLQHLHLSHGRHRFRRLDRHPFLPQSPVQERTRRKAGNAGLQ